MSLDHVCSCKYLPGNASRPLEPFKNVYILDSQSWPNELYNMVTAWNITFSQLTAQALPLNHWGLTRRFPAPSHCLVLVLLDLSHAVTQCSPQYLTQDSPTTNTRTVQNSHGWSSPTHDALTNATQIWNALPAYAETQLPFFPREILPPCFYL